MAQSVAPDEIMKFIADRTLGKLAKGLRMLGYDTVYFRGGDLHRLLHLAREEDRILLTRNTKLALQRPNDRILTLTDDDPSRQLEEVVRKASLRPEGKTPFSRCLLCNEPIEKISPHEAEGKIPEFIFIQQKEFYRCPQCRRIYWQGSHLENMAKKVEKLRKLT
jgi:uncharacterized protein with PIN domain